MTLALAASHCDIFHPATGKSCGKLSHKNRHTILSRTPSYIIVCRLILHHSLNTVGQETEDGASPQEHGETTKHLDEKMEQQEVLAYSPFILCGQEKTLLKTGCAVTCLQNLTHSGVVGGGVRALGPSLARFSAALAQVKPCVERN